MKKLENRATNVIGELFCAPEKEYPFTVVTGNPLTTRIYKKLADLYADWRDYEEPKGNWYINEFGTPTKADFVGRETLYDKCRKNFGNFFGTKEEAELAVRRLEALKRLKDEGMIIYSFKKEKTGIDLDFYTLTILAPRDKDSLDLLFGGEE